MKKILLTFALLTCLVKAFGDDTKLDSLQVEELPKERDTVYIEKTVYIREISPEEARAQQDLDSLESLSEQPHSWSLFCFENPKPYHNQEGCVEFPPIRIVGSMDNGEGIGWGLDLGYHFDMGGFQIPLAFLFQTRFDENRTWQSIRPNVYRRYADQRYILALASGIQKIWLRRWITYSLAGMGWSFGDIKGTSRSSESRFIPFIEAGGGIRLFSRIALTTGFQFADMVHDQPYRFSFRLGWMPW